MKKGTTLQKKLLVLIVVVGGKMNMQKLLNHASRRRTMAITVKEMAQGVLKILDDVTKDIPADRREQAKIDILNGFSAQMFQAPPTKEKT